MRRHAFALAAAAGLLVLVNTSAATTLTFATFADPSGTASNPLFTMTEALDSVSASYSGTGLTLQVPFTGDVFTDVTFNMPQVAVDAVTGLTLAPGSIEFYQGANLIMTINYRSARLTEFGFGARNRATDPDNVEIVYSGFPPSFELTEESFAFSFANYATPAQGWVTTTASFTSSAIPEPATLVVLGIGFVAMLRRRR